VAQGRLDAHRRAWQSKPALRAVYEDLYARIARACVAGPTLEIGGGSGNLKDHAPDVISTDIQAAPWLDAVCDAHALPFASAHFANLVMFDVLHHLVRPLRFFEEAARVLAPGGRVVMVEPALSLLSRPFYTYVHEEPVDLADDPLRTDSPSRRDPYAANQAIPTLLFGPLWGRHRARLAAMCPALAVRERRMVSLLAYPLTGGFRPWSLIPAALVRPALRIESALAPVLGPLCAFRMLVVMERRA
jgi:SAM-dependent methyltransferase